jgi:ATP-dependent helicase/nuclease subunit B
LHEENRSSEYLFLGSSGGFLHEIREKVLDKTDGIFNNNFKVINQYVVEEIKKMLKDKIHVDNSMLAALVLDVIEDNSNMNDLLKSGNGIVELFMTYYSVVNEYSVDRLLGEIQMVEDELIKEFIGIYAKFETMLRSKNMYSTYDAYRLLSNLIQDGQYSGNSKKRILFVDGFDDLSNLVRNFLAIFTGCFEESYITIPSDKFYNVTESSFEEFIKLCKSRNYNTSENVIDILIEKVVPNKINMMCDAFEAESFETYEEVEYPFKIAEVRNPHEQIMLTASLIKELVVKQKKELDHIAVITRDINKSGKLIADAFDKYGIPFRFEGDVPILESININRLILPFKVYYSGFDPELLLSYIESGYVGLEELSFAEFEKVFEKAGLAYGNRQYNQKYYHTSFKSRKNEWLSKIRRYKSFLQERLMSLSNIIDEQFNEAEEIERDYQHAVQAEIIIRNTFNALREMFGSSRKVPVEVYEEYFKKQHLLLEGKHMVSDAEFEQIAIKGFFDNIIVELKKYFIVMKKDEQVLVNPTEYWKYLNLLLQNKSFHSSSFIENRCMIMDLEASRYRNKDIKIYVDMLDGRYPKTGINKIYEYFSIDGVSLQDSAIQREERNFILSVKNTNEKIIMIYPMGDISGNPLIRSFYIDRFLNLESGLQDESKHHIDVSRFGEFEDYSVHDFISDKLNKIDLDSGEFEEICEAFDIDWEFIKQSVNQMKANNLSHFLVDDQQLIKELFGNTLSPSKYGVLRRCFKEFYFKYLLKIRFSQNDNEGFDYATEGQILHSVLHSLFLYLSNEEKLLENLDERAFKLLFEDKVVDFIEKEITAKMFHPDKILFDAELEYFKKLIYEFLIRYRSSKLLLSNPEPEKFENTVFFPTEFEISVEKSDEIKIYQDPDIYLIGKIDRVDKNPAGDMYIYDYKRSEGSTKKENVFQLMLYAYAERIKGNSVAGMAFLPIKSKLKKISGAFLSYDEENDLYYILNRGKPDKKKAFSFEEMEREIIDKIQRVFSGNLNPDEETSCFRCDLEKTGLCFLRKCGDPKYDQSK